MISYMKGLVAQKSLDRVILEVGFVGYEILMPSCALADVGSVGQNATVHTYLHIRENELSLYGFSQPDQRSTFLKLIEVNGVGPKVALAALSALDVSDLIRAIVTGDCATIATIPGVGKKTAQRIALDLKDAFSFMADDQVALLTNKAQTSSSFVDAKLALESMGFSPLEVAQALKQGNVNDSTEVLIAQALKHFAQ